MIEKRRSERTHCHCTVEIQPLDHVVVMNRLRCRDVSDTGVYLYGDDIQGYAQGTKVSLRVCSVLPNQKINVARVVRNDQSGLALEFVSEHL
ncbi:PilZ domain-containing protein [Sessilibacter sp. MAH2]